MIGVETCDRCGYDRNQWNEQDASRTLAHAGAFLVEWSSDAPPELMDQLDARRIDDLKAISSSPDLYDEIHHLWHGLVSIADVRRTAGDAVHRQTGSLTQVSTSNGGVPKTAVDTATVGLRGLEGDTQEARAHHGRPWQAVCLWSQEVIDGFAADGHPIKSGAAGDNLTLSGIDWDTLHGGTIIQVGDRDTGVRLQLSAPAVPCQKNAQWFTDGEISLMDHDLHPGSSRWYASVIRTGSVSPGDTVTVSPN